jgi:hypothetical protein
MPPKRRARTAANRTVAAALRAINPVLCTPQPFAHCVTFQDEWYVTILTRINKMINCRVAHLITGPSCVDTTIASA